jgi:hypothetical protein
MQTLADSMETLNTKSSSLVHVHSCVHCGAKFRRERFEVRALTSGVFHCPRCLHEGPLNVEICPESELEDVHLNSGR